MDSYKLGIVEQKFAELIWQNEPIASGELVTQQARGHRTDFISDISLRFPKYETAFRYYGAIVDGFIGNAPTQCCDARIMKETMEMILKNCDGVDPLINEKSFPTKWFC